MEWRIIASLAGGAVALASLTAAGTVLVTQIAPPARPKAPPPAAPLLLAERPVPALTPAVPSRPVPIAPAPAFEAAREATPLQGTIALGPAASPAPEWEEAPRRPASDLAAPPRAAFTSLPPASRPAVDPRPPGPERLPGQGQAGLRPERLPAPERQASLVPDRPQGFDRPTGLVPDRLPAPVPPAPSTEGVLTPAEIGRMRRALRLTAEQEPHWHPVEAVLREIGTRQIELVRAGRKPEEAYSGTTMRLFSVARPLLGVLREDQKVEIRKRAKLMGFESVAGYI
ncbi:MAG TPA: hypothetical protein VHL98_20955 [Microvirga sp.]|jgi:hypothetical protein|nr:hypothetical protein [Microvirga sp.]